MNIDLTAAAGFMAGHARVLDRRRFELLTGDTEPAAVLAALDGYRNPDGGYGWGLEPDLRSPESQPAAALHAFEVFAEVAPATSPRAAELCDWLESITLPDGGLPFALPLTQPVASSHWWAGADATASSLQITSIVAANALHVARHDPAVARHRWLDAAVRYCLAAIDALVGAPQAMELAFMIRFLDALHDTHPKEATALLDRLRKHVPADGRVHVQGGTETEDMRPLDFAPDPGRPARTLFTPDVAAADLRRVAGEQRDDDGGWTVEFAPTSPAAGLEWRGYITVWSVSVLRRNA